MQHSIKEIGNTYEILYLKRKEEHTFISKQFFEFAQTNRKKYSLVDNGDDLLVSSWYSDHLIDDYLLFKSIDRKVYERIQ